MSQTAFQLFIWVNKSASLGEKTEWRLFTLYLLLIIQTQSLQLKDTPCSSLDTCQPLYLSCYYIVFRLKRVHLNAIKPCFSSSFFIQLNNEVKEMTIVLRKMKDTDLPLCAKELMAAFKDEPWQENWTYEQAYTRIDEIMSSRVSRGFIAEDESQIIAMLCGRIMTYLEKKIFYIDECSVDPHYRGQHLGQKIMEYAKQEMKQEGITHFYLLTEKGFPCVTFYQKQGFTIHDHCIEMGVELSS